MADSDSDSDEKVSRIAVTIGEGEKACKMLRTSRVSSLLARNLNGFICHLNLLFLQIWYVGEDPEEEEEEEEEAVIMQNFLGATTRVESFVSSRKIMVEQAKVT